MADLYSPVLTELGEDEVESATWRDGSIFVRGVARLSSSHRHRRGRLEVYRFIHPRKTYPKPPAWAPYRTMYIPMISVYDWAVGMRRMKEEEGGIGVRLARQTYVTMHSFDYRHQGLTRQVRFSAYRRKGSGAILWRVGIYDKYLSDGPLKPSLSYIEARSPGAGSLSVLDKLLKSLVEGSL